MRVYARFLAALLAAPALLLAPGCGSDDGGNGPPAGDNLEVSSVHPSAGSTQADANADVSVVFDRDLTAATVTPAAFIVASGPDTLMAQVQYSNSTHSVVINAPLLPNEDYQGSVNTTVTGAEGERLSGKYQWNFTTRAWQEAGLGPINGSGGTAFIVDQSGRLHLLFWEAIAGPRDLLRYATCNSQCSSASNWSMVGLDTTNSGGPVSIAIGSNGEVAIGYQLASSANLRFGICTSGCLAQAGWQLTTLGLSPGNEGYSLVALAAESGGGFHLLTGLGNGIELVYANCTGSCTTAANWQFNVVDPHPIGPGSLTRSPDGAFHIIYDVTDGGSQLRYATCSTGCLVTANWHSTDLGSSSGPAALVADDAGGLHGVLGRAGLVNYLACSSSCLVSSQWSSTPIDTYQCCAPHAAIAVGPNGRFHAVIGHDDSNEFRYATCVTACTSQASWRVKEARPGDSIRHPQVVVDGAGFVHSVYEDLASSTMKAAQ